MDWRKKDWIKVKSISNNGILLGKQSSKAVAVDHNTGNLKTNCIYLIDDSKVTFKSTLPGIGRVHDIEMEQML